MEDIFANTSIETKQARSSSSPKAAAASDQASGGEVDLDSAPEVVEGLALLANNGKDRREAEAWKVRWPSPPSDEGPGDKDAIALRQEWEKTIDKDAVGNFFPKKTGSMDCGNGE